MTTIYNSKLLEELNEVAKIQTSRDKTPNQIADKVVPVIDVNPKHARIINRVAVGTCTNATSATAFTTDANRDTYLQGVTLAYIKDATSTALSVSIAVFTEEQGSVTIAQIPCLSLTAASGSLSVMLPVPMKLQRNTACSVRASTNVANVTVTGCFYLSMVDNPNA